VKLLVRLLRFLFRATLAALPACASAGPGDLDLSFNPRGTGSPPGTVLKQIHGLDTNLSGVALLPEGEILALGSADGAFLIRWLPDGSLDPAFGSDGMLPVDTGLLSTLGPMVVQADGKILLASGPGAPAKKILRLLPDGTPDPAFGAGGAAALSFPGAGGFAGCLALQSDGKILAGGAFLELSANVGHFRPCLLRFLPDGGQDQTFGISGFLTFTGLEGHVVRLAVQPDGKIVMAGSIFVNNSQGWLARSDPAGILDPAFGINGSRPVPTMDHISEPSLQLALQSDGKILFAGDTQNLLSPSVVYLERYNQDGSPDTSFNGSGRLPPGATFGFIALQGLSSQSDGKLILSGFSDGRPLSLARYLTDGSPDAGFGTGGLAKVSVPPGLSVRGLLRQQDGKFLMSGESWDAPSHAYRITLLRCMDRTLTESLSAEWPAGTALTNGGMLPMSTVRGAVSPQETTITLRNTGPAPLTNLSARLSGINSSHFSLLSSLPPVLPRGGTVTLTVRFLPEQQVSSFGAALVIDSGDPDTGNFVVILRGTTESAVATLTLWEGVYPLSADAIIDFGYSIAAKTLTRVFTVKNTGNVELQIQGITVGPSGTPGDFTAGLPETDRLAPGASSHFPVTFTPAGPGLRSARLRIASTDSFNPPLEIKLYGRRAEGLDAWRLTYFDTILNEGPAADLADPDHDGIPNLLEYATLTPPVAPDPSPGRLALSGDTLEYTFTRPAPAPLFMDYALEWTDSLQHPWTPVDDKFEVISDDGVRQLVQFTLPAGNSGRRFVRLRVSRL
jgi:uncharacterized delta-60 repeat protein